MVTTPLLPFSLDMSAIPELKQKKIERDARIAKEELVASAASDIQSAELIQKITERAKTYEEEYQQVGAFYLKYII